MQQAREVVKNLGEDSNLENVSVQNSERKTKMCSSTFGLDVSDFHF